MRTVATFLTTVSAIGLSVSALAQNAAPGQGAPAPAAEAASTGGLEEIVVTAQKREQNLQDIPVAMSAVSGEALAAKGVTQFENLVAVSPGLTITSGSNATSSSINLRGIGTFAFSIGVEPSVAVVIDDVAVLQQAQAFSNLTDIERVEVLRGPQGTLFGKNASAGAINIVTKAPTRDLTGRIGVTATTDDEYRFEAGLSGPLADGVGFRVGGFYGDRKGYVRNLTTGTRLGRDESYGIRGKLTADLTEALTVGVSADHSVSKGNGTPRTFREAPATALIFGAPIAPNLVDIDVGADNYRIRQETDATTRSEQTSVSGRASLDLGGVRLLSVTSYQDWTFQFREDPDYVANVFVIQSSPFKSHNFSQEFRLLSDGSGPLQYLAGLYFADGETSRTFLRGGNPAIVANWAGSTGTRSYAAFAQASYDIGETTHVDGGIRVNREKIDVRFQRFNLPAVAPVDNRFCTITACTGNASDDEVTYKLALRQDLTDQVMTYASYSTGYKGQGYDVSTGFNPARALNPVKPETSKSYEVGIKSRFLDNRVQLNVTGFLVDYNNFQAQSVIVQPDGGIVVQLNNVGKLRSKGIEFELNSKPTPTLSVDFAGAFTDAKIRRFPFANCFTGQTSAQGCFDVDGTGPGTQRAQDLAGKRLANAPRWKLTASANQDIILPDLPFAAFINADVRYQSGVNFDLAQNPRFVQKSYTVVNANIGIKQDEVGYRVALFVNNLFDKTYAANVGTTIGAPADVVSQILPRDSRRYFGIRAGYTF